MKYGYFDNKTREYVITRPDTPAPWVNYLGSPHYGAIISNNAGGYSFAESGAGGRILRYVFNDFDQPGRYIYIRDNAAQDFWSASWQPVGKDLEEYQCECRHGLGVTRMTALYREIASEVTYYVPLNGQYEVWLANITNQSDEVRDLTLTGYAEFTNHGNYEQDQVNLQYSLFISRTLFAGNHICQQLHGNLDAMPESNKMDEKTVTERIFGLAGAPVSSFCGDKSSFLGKYRQYGNPAGVERGDLGNITSYNENACGALSAKFTLLPGESKCVAFILGEMPSRDAGKLIDSYADCKNRTEKELQDIHDDWEKKLEPLQVKTPSAEFDEMVNTWNAYNCFLTFTWSRSASLIYCGLRNGYGYRDTVQDIQGIIHLAPQMAKDRICFMLSAQAACGGGLPLVKFTHHPGHEDTPDDPSYVQSTGHPAYRADDALWLFPTVYKYIAETGDLGLLDKTIPFADRDEGTAYEHLKRAIDFSMNHMGPHGLPAGLYADWNDCLRLGKKGESSFVAMQFYYALRIMKIFAEQKKDTEYAAYLETYAGDLKKRIGQLCWNGDRFIRGYTEDGAVIGAASDPEANLWLNPQSWSVICGLASEEEAALALDRVHARLNTAFGATLMAPPYHSSAFDGALAVIYNQGAKENAGIFSQSQGWLILAEALCGHGNRAFEYYIENCPAAQEDMAQTRCLEPYCYGQFTEGPASPHFGRSQVHWLTGTASTMMVGCVEGILGLRPALDGIELNPSIPSDWEHLEISKTFRGSHLQIVIENPDHKESGFTSLTLNGNQLADNFVPANLLEKENELTLTL